MDDVGHGRLAALVGHVSNTRLNAPVAKEGAASPALTVLFTANAPKNHIFPPVDASNSAHPVTVPHVTDGAGKMIDPLFEVTADDPDPELTVVDPDP